MRIAEGKKNFVMVDPVGNSVIHGRPDIDRKWSLDTEYVPGQDVEDNGVENRICPVCGVQNDSGNSKCWICGYDFISGLLNGEPVDKKKRRLPKFVDGDLVFLDEMEGEIMTSEDKIIAIIIMSAMFVMMIVSMH